MVRNSKPFFKFASKYSEYSKDKFYARRRQKQKQIDILSNISSAIKTHKSRRASTEQCTFSDHRALYCSMRICYENKICNEQLQDLLTEIYICEGNLQAIFGLLLPTSSRYEAIRELQILYPGLDNYRQRWKTLRVLEHYLRVISKIKVNIGNKRLNLIDVTFNATENLTPLMAATTRKEHDMVLLLLRYGANPFINTGYNGEQMNCIEYNVSSLNTVNSLYQFRKSVDNDKIGQILKDEEGKGLRCLQYFRRTVLSIPLVVSNHVQTTEIPDEDERKGYCLHPRLASELDLPSFIIPQTLQHICKIRIRTLLQNHVNTSIPACIDDLPVPVRVKQYLDLFEE